MCATNCFAPTQPSLNFFWVNFTCQLRQVFQTPCFSLDAVSNQTPSGSDSLAFTCRTGCMDFLSHKSDHFIIERIAAWHIHDRVENSCEFWGNDTQCKEPIPKIRNKFSQKMNWAATVPISTFMCLWATYILPPSVCLFLLQEICGPILSWENTGWQR